MKLSRTLAPLALLATLVHCGGGSTPAPAPAPAPVPVQATTLSYTDPTTGTYLLKKNTALSSPASHLVLELWGPGAPAGCGVTAILTVDATKAAWVKVAAGDAANTFVANGTVFALGAGVPILKGKVSGGTLIATVAEKGLATAKALNGPLLRFFLDLTPKADLLTGSPIALAADAAKCQVLLADGSLAAITITVGTLVAQ